MKKSIIPLILLLITATVFTSGCETKTANQTWGQQNISLNAIEISENTTGESYERNGTSYYRIYGYLLNKNIYDALNVQIRATGYDASGAVVAENESAYLNPKSIPHNGVSYFYFRLPDPDKKIMRFEVKVLNATAQYF